MGSLHWPVDSGDFGHHGVSYLDVLILFEQLAGHRLLSEKVVRPHERVHRPISISSVPVSEGIEILQGCQFVSSLIQALGKLPGGIGRFVPCSVGSIFPGCGILFGNSVLMVSPPSHWSPDIITVLRLFVVYLGSGSPLIRLMGLFLTVLWVSWGCLLGF